MNTTSLNRRHFIARSLALTAGLSPALTEDRRLHAAGNRAGNLQPIRLGAPAFARSDDPEQLAQAHRKLGYRAAYCPNIPLDDSSRIEATRAAFAKHDVVIAEVGRWVNLLEPDPVKRRKNLEFVTAGLALAEAVGARCCVDIAGSFNPTVWYGPHPENFSKAFFDAAVENARKIIDAVKPRRTTFAYEMMGWAMPESPDRYLKLIKAVDRKAFAVHLDPCNLVNSPEKFYRNADLINECFDKLGRWIVSCHAKDLKWNIEMNVHFQEVIPGTGSLDYPTYLHRVAQLPQGAPLMIEHLGTAEEYDQARKFIQGTGESHGITF